MKHSAHGPSDASKMQTAGACARIRGGGLFKTAPQVRVGELEGISNVTIRRSCLPIAYGGNNAPDKDADVVCHLVMGDLDATAPIHVVLSTTRDEFLQHCLAVITQDMSCQIWRASDEGRTMYEGTLGHWSRTSMKRLVSLSNSWSA